MKKPVVSPQQTPADEELAQLILFFNETLGFCPNSVLTMQRRPAIAKAFVELNKAVMANHGQVTSALKRLIAYISSHTTGCQYCQAHTIRAAERYGAEQEKLNNIWDYAQHPAFSEAERVALDLAVAASNVPNGVDDALAERARKYWDEGELVEIMGVIALFGYLNRWNDSMGTPIESGAVDSAQMYLSKTGWSGDKHRYEGENKD